MEKENVLNFHYKQTQFSFIQKSSLSTIFNIIEVFKQTSINFREEMLIEMFPGEFQNDNRVLWNENSLWW